MAEMKFAHPDVCAVLGYARITDVHPAPELPPDGIYSCDVVPDGVDFPSLETQKLDADRGVMSCVFRCRPVGPAVLQNGVDVDLWRSLGEEERRCGVCDHLGRPVLMPRVHVKIVQKDGEPGEVTSVEHLVSTLCPACLDRAAECDEDAPGVIGTMTPLEGSDD